MKKKKGISLVEILVALAIIGISSILLFGAMSNSSLAISRTGIRQQNFQKAEYGLSTALEEDNTIDGKLELLPTETQTAQQKEDQFGITVAKDSRNNTLQTYTFSLDNSIKVDYETFVADVTPDKTDDNDYLFDINVNTPDVPTDVDPEGTLNFNIINNWGSGYEGEIVLVNNSDITIENWQIEFNLPNEFSSIWSVQLVSHVGNNYVYKNVGWNSTIKPGETLTIGFISTSAFTEPPTNFKFTSDNYNWP